MINGDFRPWGKPHWLLKMSSFENKDWFLIGNISTQDRCLSMSMHHGYSYNLAGAGFLEIIDAESEFSEKSKIRRDESRRRWDAQISSINREIHTFGILDPIKRLKRLVDSWIQGEFGKNIILDASTMPERFLFPIVRWLIEAKTIENLVVTYMLPESYTHYPLAYDAGDAGHLPTFLYNEDEREIPIRNVVVGVGFLPFSLPEWLKKTFPTPNVKVSLVFPFPSNPNNVRRGWEFVRHIEPNVKLSDNSQIARVDAHDLSGCLDRIRLITNSCVRPTVFAPFGPKAHSIAMCIEAIRTGAEVYYTHPTFYHPEYSTGIKMDGKAPYGNAYALRINGKDLY